MTIGVGVIVWERDLTTIFACQLQPITIEKLSTLYEMDYSDLANRVGLSDLRAGTIAENGWTRWIVSWTASLNAYDHEIRVIYYDVVIESPDGEFITRQYQIHSQEVVP